MILTERIDWSKCQLVELKSGAHSDTQVLRGTRMLVNSIIDTFDYGVSVAEIAGQFEVPSKCVQAIVTYPRATALRILFGKKEPVGVRRFLIPSIYPRVLPKFHVQYFREQLHFALE